MPRVSVLMPAYNSEKYIATAIESILNQTFSDFEFIIINDGSTDNTAKIVRQYARQDPRIKFIDNKKNRGLIAVLNMGLDLCTGEYIARMDSDDISMPDRCERQLEAYREQPELSLLSGTIAEFGEDPEHIENYRRLPESHEDIVRFAKKRNPMNHMAVMFRKSNVTAAGSYQPIGLFEDYDLWVRMLMQGCRAANLPEVLVRARVGNGMIARRGGLSYAEDCLRLQKRFYRAGFISLPEAVINSIIRGGVSLVPSGAREVFYKKVLRKG